MEDHDRIHDLIGRAQDSDQQAFDELTGLYRPRLKDSVQSWARFQLGPPVDVEDVLQSTMLRALKSLPRFVEDGQDSFFRWLCGIAKRALAQAVQDKRRDDQQRPVGSRIGGVEDSDPTQSTVMRREERFSRLESCLKELPPEQREVLVLSRIEGLTVKQIAERTGRTAPSVKYQLTVALRGLRASFGETESFHLPDRRLELGDNENDS